MPLMDSNKHFRKRLGKRGIAFSWAPSVLAQQNGRGMGMAAPERVRFLAAGKRHASAHCTVTPASKASSSIAPLGSSAAVPHLDTITP